MLSVLELKLVTLKSLTASSLLESDLRVLVVQVINVNTKTTWKQKITAWTGKVFFYNGNRVHRDVLYCLFPTCFGGCHFKVGFQNWRNVVPSIATFYSPYLTWQNLGNTLSTLQEWYLFASFWAQQSTCFYCFLSPVPCSTKRIDNSNSRLVSQVDKETGELFLTNTLHYQLQAASFYFISCPVIYERWLDNKALFPNPLKMNIN